VTYGLFGTFVAVDGARPELVRHLLEAAQLPADDPACIEYVISTAAEAGVSVFEVWDDEAAPDASLEREDVRALINRARPYVAGLAGRTRLEVHGGKGLSAGA
jgi:quinol monooxygenase YgiN